MAEDVPNKKTNGCTFSMEGLLGAAERGKINPSRFHQPGLHTG